MNNYEDLRGVVNSYGYQFEIRYDGIKSIADADNLCSYINFIIEFDKKLVRNKETHIFYRGQAKDWRLMPKVFRNDNIINTRSNFNELEKKYYYEALTSFPEEFAGLTSLDKLAKMQHYGYPTRLLDVTTNPLAALWFACSDIKYKDQDGYVFIFRTNTVLPYDSDRALMLACLPRLDANERHLLFDFAQTNLILELQKKYPEKKESFEIIQAIRSDIDIEIRDKKTKVWGKELKKVWDKYIYEIVRERSAFFNYHINPKDMLSAYFVRPQLQNSRIKNQEGAFVIFGLKEDSRVLSSCNEQFDKDIKVSHSIETVNIKIPKEKKKNILEELDLLNVNKSTLFQDMANTADYIQEKFNVLNK